MGARLITCQALCWALGGGASGKGAVPALRLLPVWWGERQGPWPGQQWLLWEYLGRPELVLGIREGLLEKVMAKLKPRSDAGFVLVRVGKGARQTE